MLTQAKVALSFVLVAFSLMMVGTSEANAGSKLPDPIKAGVAEKLFRLDCGRSLANDESVWTPGENVGRSIQFSSTCWLIKHGSEWLLWETGCCASQQNWPTKDRNGSSASHHAHAARSSKFAAPPKSDREL